MEDNSKWANVWRGEDRDGWNDRTEEMEWKLSHYGSHPLLELAYISCLLYWAVIVCLYTDTNTLQHHTNYSFTRFSS